MITISAQLVEGHIRVRVTRWIRSTRYPATLMEFELLDCPGESELALIGRCARAVELQAEASRLEEWPELPVLE